MKRIVAFRGSFKDLYDSLLQKEKDKVDRVLVLMHSDNRIPTHYIKHLEEGVYELRVSVKDKELRFLFFQDGNQLVVLVNCFVKKTQKTPRTEIEKAKRLRKEYYEEKHQ